MKTKVAILISIFILPACFNKHISRSPGIGEAEFMLSVAPRSTHVYHFKKADDYLRRAKVASKNKDDYKASYYANLSILESKLLMALSSESIEKEQLNTEIKRLKETESLYNDEKKDVVKLKKQLFQ